MEKNKAREGARSGEWWKWGYDSKQRTQRRKALLGLQHLSKTLKKVIDWALWHLVKKCTRQREETRLSYLRNSKEASVVRPDRAGDNQVMCNVTAKSRQALLTMVRICFSLWMRREDDEEFWTKQMPVFCLLVCMCRWVRFFWRFLWEAASHCAFLLTLCVLLLFLSCSFHLRRSSWFPPWSQDTGVGLFSR